MTDRTYLRPIITLTTDFGTRDSYVAAMKGVIVSINPEANIIDITHEISPCSVKEAASVIDDCRSFFPRGTINLAVVDPGVGRERRPIVVEACGQVFVGPDNGIFWPAIDADPAARIYRLDNPSYFLVSVSSTFHGRDIFAPAAGHISLGVQPSSMGAVLSDPVRLTVRVPAIEEGILKGEVIRIDHFGNIITNIKLEHIEAAVKDAELPVVKVGSLILRGLSRTYMDVPEGEATCLIGSSGYLEIAVNMGRASDIVGCEATGLIGSVCEISKAC
jgi:S-adenosylmethionine hydrolase